MTAPKYRVLLYHAELATPTFGPDDLLAEFQDAKNIGWADYLNDVPEAFFTISQDDPKLLALDIFDLGTGIIHVKIYRDATLVFGGVLGMWQANETDVIFFAYGYLALFFMALSDWDVEYTDATIKTIVDDAFTRGTTGSTYLLSKWLTSGTTENPVTTSGGVTGITLPTYKLFYKRILSVFREMAAIGIGNTTNTVVFEVTPAGVFNFWKDRGTDRTVRLAYGDGIVAGFDETVSPILTRTDILGVGLAPDDVLIRSEITSLVSLDVYGRRQEPVLLSWVRDSLEMSRVLGQRAATAVRTQSQLWLRLYPNSFTPPGVSSSLRLSDTILTKALRGATYVDDERRIITGSQVLYLNGNENVRLRLAFPPGA